VRGAVSGRDKIHGAGGRGAGTERRAG